MSRKSRPPIALLAAAALASSLAGGIASPAHAADSGPVTTTAVAHSDQPEAGGAAEAKAIPGQYIVVLKAAPAARAGLAAARKAAAPALDRAEANGVAVQRTYQHALNGFSAKLTSKQLSALKADPAVDYIVPDQLIKAEDATQSPAPSWGLDRIDQRTLPLSDSYSYTPTGSGVTVYIVDGGIRATHNEFGGRVATGHTEVNDGLGTGDCNGHGTHVAGTVGGATYGVAKNVTLVPVRITDCAGQTTSSKMIAGIDWVTANHDDPSVANMSVGLPPNTAIDQAIQNAYASGIAFVVSAGNLSESACLRSPAREPLAITVGATTNSDYLASFSNFGSCVDVFAPGDWILSSVHDSNSATGLKSGTSMAAPHVTGVAALYLQGNPTATPAQVASAITSTATPGVVQFPGAGSPNKLLFSGLTTPPALTPLKAQYRNDDSNPNDNQIRPTLQLVNTGGSTITLSDVEIRYWFSFDPQSGPYVTFSTNCDYAQLGCAQVTHQVKGYPMYAPASATNYLSVGFTPSAGTLLGPSGPIQMRFNKTNWDIFNEANDYSYLTPGTLADHTKVTVRYRGQLVWGTEPA